MSSWVALRRITRTLPILLLSIVSTGAHGSATPHWQEFGLLQRVGSAFYDASEDRLIGVGGDRRDAYALPLAAGDWRWLSGSSNEIPLAWPLAPRSSVWDAALRKVHFARGPYGQIGISTLEPVTGVVEDIVASNTAPLEYGGALVHDPVNARFWLWGRPAFGSSSEYQLWVLDLQPTPTWSQWLVDGPPVLPAAFNATIVLDAERHRMLLFQGFVLGDDTGIWALDLENGPHAWTLVGPELTEPYGAGSNLALLEAPRDRVLVLASTGALYAFSLEHDDWTLLAPATSATTTLGAGPAPRLAGALTIDTSRDALVLVAGSAPNFTDAFNDVWSFALDGSASWTVRIPNATRPSFRHAASDGHDAARRRLVLFGGHSVTGPPLNDAWALDLTAAPSWSPIAATGTPPPGRRFHSSVFDPVRDQLLVYGGSNDPFQVFGDLWALSFAGPTPTWAPIIPAGAPPPGRSSTAFVYDTSRDRFLVLFGSTSSASLGDVWELRLAPSPTWRRMTPSGAPPSARSGAMAAYDPVFDRVIVFGGYAQDQYLNQLWALNLATGDGAWQLLSAPSGPSGRVGGVLRPDHESGRLVLFGGYGVESQEPGISYIGFLGDAWQLSLGATPAWTPIVPDPGPRPDGRDHASGVYDPEFDRLIVTCGGNSGGNDTWALNFGDASTAVQLSLHDVDVTSERVRLSWVGGAPGATATVERRVTGESWRAVNVVTADHDGRFAFEDRDVRSGMELEYRLVVVIENEPRAFGAAAVRIPGATLALTASNAGRATFRIQLGSSEPATLALFDVGGRRVWSREVGTLGAGTHEVTAPDDALAPALYFVRLEQGAGRRHTKVAILR